jgi:hypothetical protein
LKNEFFIDKNAETRYYSPELYKGESPVKRVKPLLQESAGRGRTAPIHTVFKL